MSLIDHCSRRRTIDVYKRQDLKPASHRQAFYKLCAKADLLGSFGRSLLDIALRVSVAEAEKWYEEAKSEISDEFPSRIVNNLACCYAGLSLVNKLCEFLNVTWSEVFPINKGACIRYLQNGVQEYLLDGGSNNKTIVCLLYTSLREDAWILRSLRGVYHRSFG